MQPGFLKQLWVRCGQARAIDGKDLIVNLDSGLFSRTAAIKMNDLDAVCNRRRSFRVQPDLREVPADVIHPYKAVRYSRSGEKQSQDKQARLSEEKLRLSGIALEAGNSLVPHFTLSRRYRAEIVHALSRIIVIPPCPPAVCFDSR